MAISASMVKELREKTGAGMMDCKKALQETEGDMDAAVKFLREKGLAAAAKKAGRVAAEGLVATHVVDGAAAIVEVNCETDFVAKNHDFQEFVGHIAEHVAKKDPGKLKADDPGPGEALYAQEFVKGGGKTVETAVTDQVATIGENIGIRRFTRFDKGAAYGEYIHAGGGIGVLVSIGVGDESKAGSETVQQLARDLAMHVASEAPLAVTRDGIDDKVIDNERDVYRAQALEQGKPENIIEKVVEGRVNKFLAESCLLDQTFIKDPDVKVGKLIEKTAKELGFTLEVQDFARFKVGEGIEKKSDDLAAEVAKMTGG